MKFRMSEEEWIRWLKETETVKTGRKGKEKDKVKNTNNLSSDFDYGTLVDGKSGIDSF